MADAGIDVEAETDRLYQLPPGEFVAARNALAARLKSGGDKDGAAQVRALARSNVAAWAANQAYWTARSEFDAFIQSTRRLQGAHAGSADGPGLREAIQERREALVAVLSRAEARLVAAGLDASLDTLRRVSNTLEALAADLPSAKAAAPGRLVRDLEPPGFEALGPMTPSAPPSETAREPRAELEQARAGLAEAEALFERTSREAREATNARSVAEKKAEEARAALEELAPRYEKAKQRAERAAAEATAAREEAERRAAGRDQAEAALGRLRDSE